MQDTHEIKTFLCFDFGSKNIGAAVGQTITKTAQPLKTIRNRNNRPDWDDIGALIKTWVPDALIVGLPLNMENGRQEMTYASERFMRQLHGRWLLPVYSAEERLSSFEAAQRAGGTAELDPIAAQVILESWLVNDFSKSRPVYSR